MKRPAQGDGASDTEAAAKRRPKSGEVRRARGGAAIWKVGAQGGRVKAAPEASDDFAFWRAAQQGMGPATILQGMDDRAGRKEAETIRAA